MTIHTRAFALLTLLTATILAGCSGEGFMARIFPPSSTKMVAMATDPDDPDRRRQGIVMLSERSYGLNEEFVDVYRDIMLTDADPTVRSVAARAVGRSANPKYLPDLVKAFGDANADVRRNVAVALDNVTGPEAVPALTDRATRDESKDVRAAAALALRHYREIEVVRTLISALSDESFTVQYQARRARGQLTGRDLGYSPRPWIELASRDDVFDPPATERPWWDILDLTEPKPVSP